MPESDSQLIVTIFLVVTNDHPEPRKYIQSIRKTIRLAALEWKTAENVLGCHFGSREETGTAGAKLAVKLREDRIL
jgi:hypothetical protein